MSAQHPPHSRQPWCLISLHVDSLEQVRECVLFVKCVDGLTALSALFSGANGLQGSQQIVLSRGIYTVAQDTCVAFTFYRQQEQRTHLTDDFQVRRSVACCGRRRGCTEAIVRLVCLPLVSVLAHHDKDAALAQAAGVWFIVHLQAHPVLAPLQLGGQRNPDALKLPLAVLPQASLAILKRRRKQRGAAVEAHLFCEECHHITCLQAWPRFGGRGEHLRARCAHQHSQSFAHLPHHQPFAS